MACSLQYRNFANPRHSRCQDDANHGKNPAIFVRKSSFRANKDIFRITSLDDLCEMRELLQTTSSCVVLPTDPDAIHCLVHPTQSHALPSKTSTLSIFAPSWTAPNPLKSDWMLSVVSCRKDTIASFAKIQNLEAVHQIRLNYSVIINFLIITTNNKFFFLYNY